MIRVCFTHLRQGIEVKSLPLPQAGPKCGGLSAAGLEANSSALREPSLNRGLVAFRHADKMPL